MAVGLAGPASKTLFVESDRKELASRIEELDLGERAAIALAEIIHAELLLIDDASLAEDYCAR